MTASYDASGNLANLVVGRQGACSDSQGRCTQRYDYDWDEVGYLARARRWDYAQIPAGEPHYPDLPARSADADLAYSYASNGGRVVKSATVRDVAMTKHTVRIFPSLRLEDTAWQGSDYERTAATEAVYLGGLGRVVYRPTIRR